MTGLPISLKSSTRMTGLPFNITGIVHQIDRFTSITGIIHQNNWFTDKPTFVTGIIHQNDLMKILGRTTVDDTVHSPENGTDGLIVVDDHHTCSRQAFGVNNRLAP